ncbi:MAG: hypothetical protein GF344_04925 [Chitinivibrionales bacterium]|nr:hypothetical protein [Chitinivibrionales bacterium]MBD3356343.1 hypothetical protein [Chitinivibrionales bacterium]
MKISHMARWLLFSRYAPMRLYSLSYYVRLLCAGTPFTFSRFGDGEWAAILGEVGENCDGHPFSVELKAALAGTLLNPLDYFHAMQPRAVRIDGKRIGAYLRRNGIAVPWHCANVFHDANLRGKINPLIKELRKRPVVMVGPAHLRPLNKTAFAYVDFVEVPAQNCFEHTADTIMRVREAAAADPAGRIYAFSASMAANVMIHRLYPDLGAKNWLIDFGSLWDVYVGVESRSVYRKLDWRPLIAENLRP